MHTHVIIDMVISQCLSGIYVGIGQAVERIPGTNDHECMLLYNYDYLCEDGFWTLLQKTLRLRWAER